MKTRQSLPADDRKTSTVRPKQPNLRGQTYTITFQEKQGAEESVEFSPKSTKFKTLGDSTGQTTQFFEWKWENY